MSATTEARPHLDTEKLVKVLGLLGSDKLGERAAAAAAAHRMVASAGLVWSDVIPREVVRREQVPAWAERHAKNAAQRRQECEENRQRHEKELREQDAELEAELTDKLAQLGWPRLHVKGRYKREKGRWVKGETAWREALLHRTGIHMDLDQLGSAPDDALCDIRSAVQDYEHQLRVDELQRQAREATASITPESDAGLNITVQCFFGWKGTPFEVSATGTAAYLAGKLGLLRSRDRDARVKDFLDAAIAAGRIEPCVIGIRRGKTIDGYRVAAAGSAA